MSFSLPSAKDLEEGRFARVNSRAASMILAALKEEVRTECVAKKVTGSSAGLLFRLLTLYRPEGENEKIMILSQLQSDPKHSDPGKAAEALRAWLRWLQRADEVSVAKPDPSILARGLTAMTAEILQKNPEAMFRTSLVKSTLQVDTVPTMTSVLEFHRHLTSEMEILQTSSRKIRKADEMAEGARLRSLEKEKEMEKPPSSSTKRPCKFFAKDDAGCRRGANCQYQHSWDGGVGHLQKDCPTKEGQKGGGKAADASLDKEKDKGKGKGKDEAKGAMRAMTCAEGAASSATAASSTTSPSQHHGANAERGEWTGADFKELLSETTQVLKSMMTSGAAGLSRTTTTPEDDLYDTLQRQLDALKLRALTASSAMALSRRDFREKMDPRTN